ncbi:MAG: hypothetical protein Ta2B_14180 [Termitinemataceae bacterium]|nr:MAG: hypothetical protein Ta2B_14180 [Termitinemataceae bacterium]
MTTQSIQKKILEIKEAVHAAEIKKGEEIFNNNLCVLLSQSPSLAEFMILSEGEDTDKSIFCKLNIFDGESDEIIPLDCSLPKPDKKTEDKKPQWNQYTYACLLRYEHELKSLDPKDKNEYKRYTREGMKIRVLEERRAKADKAEYKIKWAPNIYGDHILTNELGVEYKIFFRKDDSGNFRSSIKKTNFWF